MGVGFSTPFFSYLQEYPSSELENISLNNVLTFYRDYVYLWLEMDSLIFHPGNLESDGGYCL